MSFMQFIFLFSKLGPSSPYAQRIPAWQHCLISMFNVEIISNHKNSQYSQNFSKNCQDFFQTKCSCQFFILTGFGRDSLSRKQQLRNMFWKTLRKSQELSLLVSVFHFFKKRIVAQIFSYKFCETFQNTLLYKRPVSGGCFWLYPMYLQL